MLLAQITSVVILTVFILVNAALWRLKRDPQPEGVPPSPRWVPALGVVLSAGMVALQVVHWVRG